jgi:hypothetical protein
MQFWFDTAVSKNLNVVIFLRGEIFGRHSVVAENSSALGCYAVVTCKGGYTLVTLPRTVTPYRDSVDGTRDHVKYQKLVTR